MYASGNRQIDGTHACEGYVPAVRDQPAPRALIILVGIAAAVIVLYGIREVASIAGPIVLALVLVIAVSPVRHRLAAWHAPTWLQVAVPFLIVVLVLLGMVGILVISATQLASLLPSYTAQFQHLLSDAQHWAITHGVSNDVLNKGLTAFDPGKIVEFAQALLGSVIAILSSMFLIVVLLLAMCLDAPVTAKMLTSGTGNGARLVPALATFAHKTRRYLIVSTVFGMIYAVLDVIALTLLDVPLPLLWGVLALIANYIPNIGFIIGLLPPAMLALLEGGVQKMLLVVAAYTVTNVVTQSFILPKFLGDAVGLSTTMTFLSLIVWTFVLGPLGAILAIPLSLLARALFIDSDPAAGWAQALVSGKLPRG
ncbi:AI-2E family transporter [Nonomuraea angiospora]|uniref:PurR-regulated permease PerM n=1 Tax=Nonomuraea angiospora TaxID=46172 RepID=A0ABR9MFE7_9ACTN|nr:AI-2E family transporter [Nonomuraea angiospora]MBE1591071.1 putative PurR-regulated permease PerM [Nonomuraea angiospora]MDX3111346.1 AI-2E family transporter [Nonomuraea angiospora]